VGKHPKDFKSCLLWSAASSNTELSHNMRSKIKAIIPSDSKVTNSFRTTRYDIGGLILDEEFFQDLAKHNALTEALSFNKPILIIHGSKDEAISCDSSLRACNFLTNSKYIPIEGATHTFSSIKHTDRLFKETILFLNENITNL